MKICDRCKEEIIDSFTWVVLNKGENIDKRFSNYCDNCIVTVDDERRRNEKVMQKMWH